MKIKALVLSKGNLEEQNIDNTLEELQKIVGGYIEIPYLSKSFKEYGIDIIINDEGKFIEGLAPEIVVVGKKNKYSFGCCVRKLYICKPRYTRKHNRIKKRTN